MSSTEHIIDIRPKKRPRKNTMDRPLGNEYPPHYQTGPGGSVDHIFIAESVTEKKGSHKKTTLSCCECRRLKLKCDRVFPCQSCKKRGCQEICPNGVLVSGKGTRFVLAGSERLHSKINEMSDRIRSLEEALEGTYSPERHRLLQPELLDIKSTVELYSNGLKRPSEITTPEKSNEHLPMVNGHGLSQYRHDSPDSVSSDMVRMSLGFPLSEGTSTQPSVTRRQYIIDKLPLRDEADHLYRQFATHAMWQLNGHVSDETFYSRLSHHCYESSIDHICPRKLSILLMILAIGCHTDLNRPTDNTDGELFYNLSRAALSEVAVTSDTDLDSVIALFYQLWYLLVFSDKKNSLQCAWGLIGLTLNLAQGIGLHRRVSKSKMIPEDEEVRRSLFWELIYLDGRLSLCLNQPLSISPKFVDCLRPTYLDKEADLYQKWRHSFYAEIMVEVSEVILQPDVDYEVVLNLDKRIRDFPTPDRLGGNDPASPIAVFLQGAIAVSREILLLQLHRSYFVRMLNGLGEGPHTRHKFAPSEIAVFLSAARLIHSTHCLFLQAPEQTSRYSSFWINAFSAAIAICVLVSRAPSTCLSPAALQELERARSLFRSAKRICARAEEVMDVLDRMIDKANDIFHRWSAGENVPTSVIIRQEGTPCSPETDVIDGKEADNVSRSHRSIGQCLLEAHHRARVLFPHRRSCNCGFENMRPSTLSGVQPPNIPAEHSSVLPASYSDDVMSGVLPAHGPAVTARLTPASRMAVLDTVNFELGALSTSTGEYWMAWL